MLWVGRSCCLIVLIIIIRRRSGYFLRRKAKRRKQKAKEQLVCTINIYRLPLQLMVYNQQCYPDVYYNFLDRKTKKLLQDVEQKRKTKQTKKQTHVPSLLKQLSSYQFQSILSWS